MLEKNRLFKNRKKFRPYNILENQNVVGEVFQTEIKKGLFSTQDYETCFYDGKWYNLYGMAIKGKGINVLYFGDVQLAQIETDSVVYNDLHHYEIYAVNKDIAYISVLMSCFMYINACYEPGIKTTKSVSKSFSETKDKSLLEKYDPNWIKNLKE